MHRNAVLKEYSSYIDPLIPDEESLLIQLCEHLHRSGFLFNDASEAELKQGEQVIHDFFEQEAQVIQKTVPSAKFEQYLAYLKRFGWDKDELRSRLRQKVMRHFEKMAFGAHHQFNIRNAIMQGLKSQKASPFQDLMLCLQTYQSMLLGNSKKLETESSGVDKNYTAQDILKMREGMQDQLEGKGFVQAVLKQIAKKRRVSVSELTKDPLEEQFSADKKILFVRPSKHKPGISLRAELKRKTPANHSLSTKNSKKETPAKPMEVPSVPVEKEEDFGIAMMVPELENFEETEADNMVRREEERDQENVKESLETIEIEDPSNQSVIESSPQQEKLEDKEEQEKPIQKASKPAAVSAADLLANMDEDDEDFDEDDGLTALETDETDVVFGTGKITPASMMSFIRQYPDSTLKFLLRRNLDGRPLPSEFEQIYKTWEERGLMRGRVRRYVLQFMDWEDVPDLPVHELLGQMRNRLMDMKLEDEKI